MLNHILSVNKPEIVKLQVTKKQQQQQTRNIIKNIKKYIIDTMQT